MKRLQFIIMAICIIITACVDPKDRNAAEQQRPSQSLYTDQVDSVFNRHFALLDSFVSDKPFTGFTDEIIKSLVFMEEVSGIISGADFSSWGPPKVPRESITNWKKWYSENKTHLMWDKQTRSIFQIEDWREQTKYAGFVDSIFNAHFVILDTVTSGKVKEVRQPFKSRITQSVIFMQDITDIPSNVDFSYLTPSPIPKESITKWKNWYSENKPFLKWNPTLKTIVRVQK